VTGRRREGGGVTERGGGKRERGREGEERERERERGREGEIKRGRMSGVEPGADLRGAL